MGVWVFFEGKVVRLMTHPLVVDLDGTVIYTDMLHESFLSVLRNHPLQLFKVPFWLFKNKALLKRRLALRAPFDPTLLPYNNELLDWLKQQKEDGRRLILCTASDQSIANPIAKHLGCFDTVMASDGVINLSGEKKAAHLTAHFGCNGFDYVGNSKTDVSVWKQARHGVVVSSSSHLVKKAGKVCNVEQVFSSTAPNIGLWARALRVHQWLKNTLLFIPLLAAHQVTHLQDWVLLLFAFFSFCLCASSVYLTNDLLDLESDRQHSRKRNRPFASGQLSTGIGGVAALLLFFMSVGLGFFCVGNSFLFWLMGYFFLTCAYSLGLKRWVLIDCVVLAILYTLRIVAGAAAIGLTLSFWLLAFSVFIFLSLSFVKRYAELKNMSLLGQERARGRGYYVSDAPLIQTFGVTAGYTSVLVLALYLNSETVIQLYRTPECIWGAVPILLFWVSWVWMQAHRGHMHDDPLVFAIKDKVSLWAGGLFFAIMVIGTVGLPW